MGLTNQKRMSGYIIYYRVSTKKQGESGLGLNAQRAFIDHYYRDKTILAEFVEIRSGKMIQNRPELQKAIALCQQHKATLVVAKIDRLSRNTEQALQIYRELDGRLESCDVPNLDKFTLTLFMAIADRERELIGLRTKQALDQKRRQVGEWRKGGSNEQKAEAGIRGAQLARELVNENDNKRRAKVLATTLRATGKNYQTIADQLNSAGFKTVRGKTFDATRVRRLCIESS